MAFTPPKIVEAVPEIQVYDHGFSEEEVVKITNAVKAIESRDIVNEPVTFEEFKNYVVPWFRIQRTSDFILKETKAKATKAARVPKEPKPKAPKKLSKAAAKAELNRLIFKLATGSEFTPEEQEFYDNYTGGTR